MEETYQTAYEEGWAAYYEGAGLGDSPYPFWDGGAEWEDGFNDARTLDRGRVFA